MQGELVKLQDWVVKTGHKVVVIFEVRDTTTTSVSRCPRTFWCRRFISPARPRPKNAHAAHRSTRLHPTGRRV